MKAYINGALICFCIILISCEGWWPGWGEPAQQGSVRPQQGSNQDAIIHHKNNCEESLYAFYIELDPNSSFICDDLKELGLFNNGEDIPFMIHKGKIGYIVFATTPAGKCSSGTRKAEYWIDMSKAASDQAYFQVCQ